MNSLIFLIDDDEDEKDIFSRALDEAGIQCDFIYFNCVEKAMNMLRRDHTGFYIHRHEYAGHQWP